MADNITIVKAHEEDDMSAVCDQIEMLMLSRKRTWPGSRGFGIDGQCIDEKQVTAVNTFAVELQDAVDTWIPGLGINRVGVEHTDLGELKYEVEVAWR